MRTACHLVPNLKEWRAVGAALPQTVAALALGCWLIARPDSVLAGVVITPWPVEGANDAVAVGAARLSGIYAVGDSYENKVEVRDIRQRLLRTISSSEFQPLLPWMTFDGGPDAISGLAVSDSGRQVFILVHDDTLAGDGGQSDGVVLFDTFDNTLNLFARAELFNRGDTCPLLAAKHFKGKLYVGTFSDGVKVFRAGINDKTGTLLETVMLPMGSPVRGLAVDSEQNLLYVAGTNVLYRGSLASSPLNLTAIGGITNICSIAFSSDFGGTNNAGLFVLAGPTTSKLFRVPVEQARGTQVFSPMLLATNLGTAYDVAATACGRLLLGRDEDSIMISEDSDSRLGFDAWVTNELDQVIHLCKSLIGADGNGPGWVTDADTQKGLPRFHPCSPDAAAWAVLGLMLADEVRGDTTAQSLVQDVLVRYAGLAADAVIPQRSADGIYRHWYDPTTGGTLGNWDPEFATLSTMKITMAAVRARKYYWSNSVVRAAASAIIDGVSNRAAYFRANDSGFYFRALQGGGPDTTSVGKPFQEAILWVEQAAACQDSVIPIYSRWLDRSLWPTAQLVTGKTVTGDSPGQFQAAFVSLYPWLLQRDFRSSTAWQASIENLWYSHAAWNDANGLRFFTVFSAGTTPTGYNADSLSNHPDDIASFPALLAFSAKGNTLPAVATYNAYRRGAREKFEGGAEILYRRSNVNPNWLADSAALPDVVLGAIGLAEIIRPGIVDELLALDMSGGGIQLRPEKSSLLELTWPLMGWRPFHSTNLASWTLLDGVPNPYQFTGLNGQEYFRIAR